MKKKNRKKKKKNRCGITDAFFFVFEEKGIFVVVGIVVVYL